MQITYTAKSLDSTEAWEGLAEAFGDGHSDAVQSTIRHLKVLGVQSYILEDPYIDRDYSADYVHFYARTFRAYPRHCRRAHFFSDDVTPVVDQPRSTQNLRQLREASNTSYCGFCVIRPLPQASIGRSVLVGQVRERPEMESTVTCRAEFRAHLFGIDFDVTGNSYLQQDARVGACAQVCVWSGMRHLHARYGYDWVSVADITRLAAPTASDEATSLPAGSDFLTSERMLRAITEAGYQPLCFAEEDLASAILPYVESGIPVILGLDFGGEIGHAVSVIGRVFAELNVPTNVAADYVPAYIVHDDQGGPYMLLPVKDSAASPHQFAEDTITRTLADDVTEIELNCRQATFAVALMSPRVYSIAEAAEISARDRIEETLDALPEIRSAIAGAGFSVNDRLLDSLHDARASGTIVIRTYLTSAAGYRRHIANGTASDDLKDGLLALHLPHFTWVTEIATIDSYNNSSAGMRRIYGHTIIDATSTGRGGDGLLALHLPGMLIVRDIDERGQEEERLYFVEDDDLYDCRTKNLEFDR